MKKITLKYQKSINTEDIRYVLYNNLDIDEEEAADYLIDYENVGNHPYATASNPVPIKTIQNILIQMQQEGLEYVEIMYHQDHAEYKLTGLNVLLETDEEQQERIRRNKKAQLNMLKILQKTEQEKIDNRISEIERLEKELKE